VVCIVDITALIAGAAILSISLINVYIPSFAIDPNKKLKLDSTFLFIFFSNNRARFYIKTGF
jgi:cytochrome c oxidase subunit I